MPLRGCTCPPSGAYLCPVCEAMRARVEGHAVEFPHPGIVAMREADLQGQLRGLALANGWRYYHTYDARRSDAGFPDTVLARPGELLFVELKSARGEPGPAQTQWLDALRQSVPGVEVHVWRPADRAAMVARLTRPSR